MRELIESIVRLIVEHPNQIRLTELLGSQTLIFELRCHADDVGKVIGKSGKTIAAIRTIVWSIAQKDGKRAVVEIVE